MTPRSAIRKHPYAWLCLVQVLSFGLFSRRMGFYHDDWPFLEMTSQGGSLGGAVRLFARTGHFWGRPLEILQFPLFFALAGYHPWRHQLLLLSCQAAEGSLLFRLLDRLLGRRDLALAAAALAMMYPNRAVTHYWFANSPQTVAQLLAAAGLVAHLSWLERRRPSALAASQSLYLLSVLSYESCMFSPLLLAGGLWGRSVHDRTRPHDAALGLARDFAPFAATLAAALAWQWAGLRWLLRAENTKSQLLAFSWTHLLKAYGAGFECVTNRVLHLCWLSLREALREFGPGLWLLWAACAALFAYGLELDEPETPERRGRALAAAGGAAAFGFVGAYAPYAVSGSYMPQIFGVMSRTNGTGAWAGGLLVACALGALGRRARRALLAAVVGAFTWTNWAGALQFVRSWRLQQDILAKLHSRAEALPRDSAVLLRDAPSFIGWAAVFAAPYDFDAALRRSTGRPDLRGNVWSPDFRLAPDRVVQCYEGGPYKEYAYGKTFYYRYSADRLEAVEPPGAKHPSGGILRPKRRSERREEVVAPNRRNPLESSPRKGNNPCEQP